LDSSFATNKFWTFDAVVKNNQATEQRTFCGTLIFSPFPSFLGFSVASQPFRSPIWKYTYATIKQAILANRTGVRIAKCPERSPLPSESGKKN
jgi:putative flippase GtrA